jgi:Uma2 family endonuclease
MAKSIEDEVAYYYDSHPTEEDLMGETAAHAALIHYLMSVLNWLFKGQSCAVYENLNFYQTPDVKEYPLAPDIAVIKGVDYQEDIRSWRVGKTGPAPHVVLEIASPETWKKDLREKPTLYAQMGAQEYFAYDPHRPPLLRSASSRLFGWHLSAKGAQPMLPGPDGRLWSPLLDSYLVPNGSRLHLYNREGSLRLTEAQAEAQAREAEAAARRVEAAARRFEAAARRAEAEARRVAERARLAAEQARQAEAEARLAANRRAEALAEKLRSLGIDPDQV